MIPRRTRPWLTFVALCLVCGSALAAPVKHSPVAARRAAPAMPDSVLARVGKQPITWTDVQAAATRFGVKPDTLTPKQAREFLDVLVDQKAITAQTTRLPRLWTARDSADYHGLVDRLELDAALDSALAIERVARVARGDTALDKMSMGVAVRDAAVKAVRFTYDEPLIARVAAAFDSLPKVDGSQGALEQLRMAGMLPHVSHADSVSVIAFVGNDHWTVADLFADWKRLNPLYRPRVTTPDHVKDLIHNAFYERLLRRQARAQHVLEQPAAVRMLHDKAEFLDMQAYVGREVYAHIAQDSLTLRRHYDADPHVFDVAAHAVVLRFAFESEAEALNFKVRLMRPLAVDTLLAEAKREHVDYTGSLSADDDSALVARCFAVGVGGLVGPDDTSQGWRMLRVQKLEPRKGRSFADAAQMVQRDWYDHEGERLMRALLDRLRREQGVVIHETSSHLRAAAQKH